MVSVHGIVLGTTLSSAEPSAFRRKLMFYTATFSQRLLRSFGLRSGGFSSFVHSFIRYFEVPRIKTTTSRKWSLYSGSVNNFVIPFHIFLLKRHERGVVQRERLLIFSFPWPYLDPYPSAPRVSLISFFLS